VQFKEKATQQERNDHMKQLVLHMSDNNDEIKHIYSVGNFNGFSAKLSTKALDFIQNSEIVKVIEQDSMVFAYGSCEIQNNAVWGLDRISETVINLDGIYHYEEAAGNGVDVYIIDTGILTTHVDFENRAIWGANFMDDGKNTDCNGHGTHVSGTAGGLQFGVAKKTTLIAVKVLGCTGGGARSGVIAGIQWAVQSYQSRKNPSVANMSLGGSYSSTYNDVVAEAVKLGITFVVAAGNDDGDACDYSPSSEPTAITVGATLVGENGTTLVDERTYFSNWGKCVTLFAPGSMIESDWITTNSSVKTISGTSMASPHVAGTVALYLGVFNSATPTEIREWLTSNANNNMIDLICYGTENPTNCNLSPNALLYTAC